MAVQNGGRIQALYLLNTDDGRALLAQAYRGVIADVEARMISTELKNQDLSGDLDAGSVEAKRFANAISQQYGTAAQNGANAIYVDPVTVPVNIHREIIETLEKYDAATFGVPDLISRRTRNHAAAMARELERAFFECAVAEGSAFTTTETDIELILEALIQDIETTQNDFVDGVPRDMIKLVCSPSFYGQIRGYLDRSYNANIQTDRDDFFAFHGVRVYASVYLPAGASCVAMVDGAIAQPVRSDVYQAREIPLTNAWALELYFDYGTAAVMPDLIRVFGTANSLFEVTVSSTKGATSGDTFIEVNPLEIEGGSYKYQLGTSEVAVTYDQVLTTGWTALPADGIVTVSNNETVITVAAVDSSNKAKGVGSAELVIKK